jgi:hypothetical protein
MKFDNEQVHLKQYFLQLVLKMHQLVKKLCASELVFIVTSPNAKVLGIASSVGLDAGVVNVISLP